MTNFLKKYWILIVILVLASFLRFWKLDSYPALNADEAAIGYNAYSLIQTGLDEHGNPWPIHFQSFNDYKPGLYFYVVLPFVKLLGLNTWAVRIPGATFGVLAVLAIYLLANELFPRPKFVIWNLSFGIWPAFLLAISPWHLQFSRGGWEVNLSTFLIILGMLMFLKAVKRPSVFTFTFSLLPFALSLYAYHAARMITPLLGLGLAVIYGKDLFVKKNLKLLILSFSFLILLLLPLARDLFTSNVLSRAAGVGLFADQGPINRINEQRGEHGDVNSLAGKLIHNKVVNYGLAFAENWAAHYHGLFLFVSGDDIQRDKVPETGQMYLIDIVFVLIGLAVIARNYSLFPKTYSLILYWLLIAPIAAALTFQAPHALRAENMVTPLVIVSAIGLVAIIGWTSRLRSRKLLFTFYFLLFTLIAWSFTRYLHMYWIHMSKEYPFSSQYGLKELAAYISQNESRYQKVYITDKYDQPYILFLFYLNYPPQEFQGHHTLTPRDQFGFSTVRDFGKFHFESLDFEKVLQQHSNVLIAAAPDEVPKGTNIVKRVYGENGYEYFDIIRN